MSFTSDLAAFTAKVEARQQAVFVNTAVAVKDSITVGSPVTGSPGQPVDTSNLLNSWQLSFPTQSTAEITTNVVYAPAIEEGVGPHGALTLRSAVGGFHSVAATRSNFDLLVGDVVRTTIGG